MNKDKEDNKVEEDAEEKDVKQANRSEDDDE